MRFHAATQKTCGICSNPQRDMRTLAIVATDTDLAALERSGTFRGTYFVIGGTVSLASEKGDNLRIAQLLVATANLIEKGLEEVILAFPANPEGDATNIFVREHIVAATALADIKVTSLGRGLSTGSELEYADSETLKSAFESRR
jgi:recombination protein RecR